MEDWKKAMYAGFLHGLQAQVGTWTMTKELGQTVRGFKFPDTVQVPAEYRVMTAHKIAGIRSYQVNEEIKFEVREFFEVVKELEGGEGAVFFWQQYSRSRVKLGDVGYAGDKFDMTVPEVEVIWFLYLDSDPHIPGEAITAEAITAEAWLEDLT